MWKITGLDGVSTAATSSDSTSNQELASEEVKEQQQPTVDFVASLVRHAGGVNCVRWSPDGQVLASAGDDGSILLWRQSQTHQKQFGQNDDFADTLGPDGSVAAEAQQETWVVFAVLLNPNRAAIYDLAWSPCGTFIASASNLDNAVNVYEVSSRKLAYAIGSHSHFVQGVSWDPRNEMLASQSSDRSVHVHQWKKTNKDVWKASTINRSSKLTMWTPPPKVETAVPVTTSQTPSEAPPLTSELNAGESSLVPTSIIDDAFDNVSEVPPPSSFLGGLDENVNPNSQPMVKDEKPKTTKIYLDETFVTFFRRLSFSPDGSFLFAPTGIHKADFNDPDTTNCVHIYARNAMNKEPIASLPGHTRPPTCVRFSPKLYQLTPSQYEPIFKLPYRMLAAVGSKESISVYDTQRAMPVIQLSSFHYSSVTDVAWHPSGNAMLITSQDGFCSLVCFNAGELGVEYVPPPPASVETVSNEDVAMEIEIEQVTGVDTSVPVQQPSIVKMPIM